MDIKDYAERNRAAWNQVAPIHQRHRKTNLKEAVKSESFSTLDDIEQAIFERLSVKRKTVAQLCCNNGRELISVVKRGAFSGVGFDISDETPMDSIILAAHNTQRNPHTPSLIRCPLSLQAFWTVN